MPDLDQKAQEFLAYIWKCTQSEKFWENTVLDHICYRSQSLEEYQKLKLFLGSKGNLLADNQINGREISVYKLAARFTINGQKTQLLELTQPKEERSDASGFEHIELVTRLSLRQLVMENTHLNFNTKNIDGSNPEIRLNFKQGCIKFRNVGLQELIAHESPKT